MKKSELETGMIVLLRNGTEFMVVKGTCGAGIIVALDGSGKLELCGNEKECYFGYDEDTLDYRDTSYPEFNIVAVYSARDIYHFNDIGKKGDLLWSRDGWMKSFIYQLHPDSLVLVYKDKRWQPRYFDNVENDVVYVWADGCTSHTAYKKERYTLDEVDFYKEDYNA